MSDEHNLRQSIERARKMRQWAQGPDGFFALMDTLEQKYLDALVQSDAHETALREHFYMRVQVLRDLRRVMVEVITSGKKSGKDLEALTRIERGDVRAFH